VLAPVAAVAVVVLVDAALTARSWSAPAEALLDESAHLLTAWLFLAAAGVRRRAVVLAVLAGSVLIDLDHVPLYLGVHGVAPGGGRPVVHSLLTAAVLLLVSLAWRRRAASLVALAAGVCLHLVRDVATGPGVPALWPLVTDSLRVPHPVYLAGLGAVALVACLRRWPAARRLARRAA
jgi:inner membrane protein